MKSKSHKNFNRQYHANNDPKACTFESQLLQYSSDYHETLPEDVFHDVQGGSMLKDEVRITGRDCA
jgi:hypothetical protein